jgi:hypothetical protein
MGLGLTTLLLGSLSLPSMAADHKRELLIAESFDRADAVTWGAADSGQRWKFPPGSAGVTLAGYGGVFTLPAPRSGGSAMLQGKGTHVRDVGVAFSFALDRMPGSGGAVIEAIARKSASGSYRAQIRVAPRGGLWLSFSKERHGSPAGTVGRKALVPRWRYAAGQMVSIRFEVIGQDATQLRLKAWPAGTAEPRRWLLVGDDPRHDVGAPGRIGIAASLTKRATNVPVQVRFDDLHVTRTRKATKAPVTRTKPRAQDTSLSTEAPDNGVAAAQPQSVAPATTPAPTPAPLPATGSYPANSSLAYEPVPTLSMPGYLAEVRDPTYGGYITRVSNTAGWRNQYAMKTAWNADGSRAAFFGYGARLLDGVTYQDLGGLSGLPGRATWSNVDPDLVWGTGNDNRVRKYKPSNGTTTFLTVPGGFTSVDLGNAEGTLSDDDRYMALLATVSGGGYRALLWDSVSNTVAINATLPNEPDKVQASPSGRYMVVSYEPNGTGPNQGNKIYDRLAANPATPRHLNNVSSHSDFARRADGTELYVIIDGGLQAIRLSDGQATTLLSGWPGGHISGRNIDRWGWVYVSNHVYWSSRTYPGYDQLMAVKTDGSGTIQVWAHARTIQDGNAYQYDASTFATPNRDGTKIMWGGKWNATGSIYSYVVAMEPRAR